MNRRRSFTWNEEEGKGTAHKKGWTKAVEGGGGFDIWHYFVQLSFKNSYNCAWTRYEICDFFLPRGETFYSKHEEMGWEKKRRRKRWGGALKGEYVWIFYTQQFCRIMTSCV